MNVTDSPAAANSGPREAAQSRELTRLIGVYVPGAKYGQIVDVDGADYRVSEINLARPDHPVLVPVADAETSMDGGQ
jgi:hypothetical protein